MAIGHSWAEGSFADSSWAYNTWHVLVHVIAVAVERVQGIAKAIRTQIIG